MIAIYYRTDEAFKRNPMVGMSLVVPEGGLDKDDYEFVTRMDPGPSLEEVFRLMNVVDGDELPVQLKKRSMMSGDVVVDEDGDVWFCAFSGWERASW